MRIFTILDLNKVDVTPRFAEVFRSVLSGVSGSTGGWRCCWGAPSLPQLPPATPKNPPPYISLLFLCFCSDGNCQHKTWAAGGKTVFIWEPGGVGRAIWEQFYFQLFLLLFLLCCSFQLVLRSSVLTVLYLDEVNVTLRFAEVFRSVLSGVGGSTGGWRCC